MRVGFIGLGDQGLPIAQRIHAAGFPLTVWARRSESLVPFAGTDVAIAADPAELGRTSDVVGICLFDASGVRDVLLRDDGLITGLCPGGVVVVHTTLAPDEVRDIAADVTAAGHSLLDAPVSGGHSVAAAGGLTVMVGGDRQALARVRPVLASYAADIAHLGDVGAGAQAKLLNNALFAAQIVLADDVLRIGATLGLDARSLARILETSSSACTAARIRYRVGSLEGLAATHAGPTLTKDVDLLRRALSGRPREELLNVAERFAAAMRADGATGREAGAGPLPD